MRQLGLLTLAFSCAACSGRDPSRDAGESMHSLVRVDLVFTHSSSDAVRFEPLAHFVRYRAFDPASVPTLLGLPADLEGLPVDSCRASDGVADLDDGLSHGVAAEINLLDAGRLEVRGPGDRSQLVPRPYADLVPFVFGVVYSSDESAPVALEPGQTYQLLGEGGDEVGPLQATVTAPRAFPTLTVEPLRRGSDLVVRWAEPGDNDVHDALDLEIKWSARIGTPAVRCRVRDDGSFHVPHELLDGLTTTGVSATATVIATRSHHAPLYAPGAGGGELALQLRDVVTVSYDGTAVRQVLPESAQ